MRFKALSMIATLGCAGSRARRDRGRSARPRPSAAADTKLSIVAYSTPREAYGKLIPAFQKTAAGKDVDFTQSYGASGEQVRAIKAGLEFDIAALSLAPDMDELVSCRHRRREVEEAVLQGHGHTTRSSSSSSAMATRRRSRAGTTSFGRTSRWSRRTRSRRAERAGTSWPRTAPGGRSARPTSRRRRTSSSSGRTSSSRTRARARRSTRSTAARATCSSRTRTRRTSRACRD